VNRLERSGRVRSLLGALANARRFKALTGLSWRTMIGDGRRLRHGRELSWSQVLMAANTPMLLRSGLVQGRTDAGVLAAGQVVGVLTDLPSCEELIAGIVAQAAEVIDGLAGGRRWQNSDVDAASP
jgi:NAD(P)H-dependent flavin oxidoreductase YrpB (nitropropane dioxygenase family)